MTLKKFYVNIFNMEKKIKEINTREYGINKEVIKYLYRTRKQLLFDIIEEIIDAKIKEQLNG